MSIEVTSYKVEKKQNFIGKDFVQFTVETEIPGERFKHIVQRRDLDFQQLRQVLLQVYPYILIPPLPISEETKEEELPKRLKIYNRFLKSICQSEVLKSCVFLLQFCQTADRKDWEI